MKYLCLLLTVALCSSCELIFPDDEFTIQKHSNAGRGMKLNGLYYLIDNGKFYRYSLFENSIVRYLGSSDSISGNDFISGGSKVYWGLFEIKGMKIRLEELVSSGGGALKLYASEGEILNDSTFIIKEQFRLKNGEKKDEVKKEQLYHFYKFSPKPDSINPFIK